MIKVEDAYAVGSQFLDLGSIDQLYSPKTDSVLDSVSKKSSNLLTNQNKKPGKPSEKAEVFEPWLYGNFAQQEEGANDILKSSSCLDSPRDDRESCKSLLDRFHSVIDSVSSSSGPSEAMKAGGMGFVAVYGFRSLLEAANTAAIKS